MVAGDGDGRAANSITKGYVELLDEARSEVREYAVGEASRRYDDGAVFVDVRDAPELWKEGRIPDAVHVSRGMLEFCIDPESPYYVSRFGEDAEYVFVCAVGGRSLLAAQRAKEMGLERVASLEGGFTAWRDAGEPVEPADPTM
ncbi:rhodanese-like domain-containing protein [Halogeometricum limi]|uniref:Rhodanese-related sulfurtransferase n=1 Tax=Halogeometricum limi TaxID=555875 RepID=A0A1I6I9A3_9EURY|nr:rhodanese-like domain-containing protein [Halogeometricum limi]SFR63271.1 Rhodanese-related sulfurtransferase [Halogeometricum limi]